MSALLVLIGFVLGAAAALAAPLVINVIGARLARQWGGCYVCGVNVEEMPRRLVRKTHWRHRWTSLTGWHRRGVKAWQAHRRSTAHWWEWKPVSRSGYAAEPPDLETP